MVSRGRLGEVGLRKERAFLAEEMMAPKLWARSCVRAPPFRRPWWSYVAWV